VESKIPETGLKTLYSLQGVKIMTEVTEQNKGLYQTHIKITNYSETIYDINAKTDCQKLSNKYKFEIYPSDINDPKNIVENQKVYGVIKCNEPKKKNKCKENPNGKCLPHFDISFTTNLNMDQENPDSYNQTFESLSNELGMDGFCVPTSNPWSTANNDWQPSCECKNPCKKIIKNCKKTNKGCQGDDWMASNSEACTKLRSCITTDHPEDGGGANPHSG
jgi:hypothetical protein